MTKGKELLSTFIDFEFHCSNSVFLSYEKKRKNWKNERREREKEFGKKREKHKKNIDEK